MVLTVMSTVKSITFIDEIMHKILLKWLYIIHKMTRHGAIAAEESFEKGP